MYRTLSSIVIGILGRGATATLRQRHTLAVSGRSASALALVGAHAAGASSLTLDGSGVVGSVVAGIVLTLGAATYTVQGAATASSGQITVSITPVLAGSFPDNAVVAVGTHVDTTFRVFAPQEQEVEGDEGTRLHQSVVDLEVTAAVEAIVPHEGDLLVRDGVERIVREVRRVAPDGVLARWRLGLGEAA